MQIKEITSLKTKEVLKGQRQIILYNDNINSFEHVIDCLVSICGHKEHQAEQCAFITHHVGKCSVKGGSYEKLKPMFIALQMQNLSVEIK